ncbi:uncharacterized protein SAPINGB_P002291 [Magnusiomyces paraingens]|uniref:Ribophorin II C-terminal domain-containing protein n=1 Tax=Magnusiomyces paraingens TaxID=2606893 RepID=A0A5E8BD00_9ASCO|nr:uncharacterized protein SAPINGB_P002291 [Saprochaete ingens]VVT49482.1 unnamed protein product [Saprochaete ingens]
MQLSSKLSSASLFAVLTVFLSSVSASELSWVVGNGKVSVSNGPTTDFSKQFKSSKASTPIAESVVIPPGSTFDVSFDTLISNATSKAEKATRAHQTVLLISSPKLGVDFSYPISTRASGKDAKLSLSIHKKLPEVLLNKAVAGPLKAEIVVGGFDSESVEEVVVKGTSEDEENKESPKTTIKKIYTPVDPTRIVLTERLIVIPSQPEPAKKGKAPAPKPSEVALPVRNEALPEIHHIFRAPPHTISRSIALASIVAILGCIMVLINSWTLFAGVNLGQLPQALKAAPLAHTTFMASILASELLFYKYYLGDSIFQTLASLAVVAPIAVYSGSRALREIKTRRLNGLI